MSRFRAAGGRTPFVGRYYSQKRLYYSAGGSKALKQNFVSAEPNDLPCKEVSVYVHWPFCESKCTYCSFNKYVNPPVVDHLRFKKAFLAELSHSLKPYLGYDIHSVYFGGGTPSLAQSSTFAAILELLGRECTLGAKAEITLEANPTSVELKKFSEFKAIGINRVSLGIQAFNNHDLRVMGRNHTFEDGLQALETINALFDNTTFDLILARPNQSLLQWEAELKLALSYAKNHMSIYQLMIEPGTRFYKMYQAGLLPLPAPEVIEDMYFETIKVMASHGFEHYEVSSYGRNGCVGHHNFSYWRGFDYIGIGPGAHGRVRPLATSLERCRTYRIHSPELWLRSCEELGHGLRKIEAMPPAERYKELIVLGLRTKMGVSLFEVPIRDVFNLEALLSYVNKGFLAISGGFENLTHLFPTEEGLAVIDSVLVDILKI